MGASEFYFSFSVASSLAFLPFCSGLCHQMYALRHVAYETQNRYGHRSLEAKGSTPQNEWAVAATPTSRAVMFASAKPSFFAPKKFGLQQKSGKNNNNSQKKNREKTK